MVSIESSTPTLADDCQYPAHEPAGRKPYQPPQIWRYGEVRDETLGGSGFAFEDSGSDPVTYYD